MPTFIDSPVSVDSSASRSAASTTRRSAETDIASIEQDNVSRQPAAPPEPSALRRHGAPWSTALPSARMSLDRSHRPDLATNPIAVLRIRTPNRWRRLPPIRESRMRRRRQQRAARPRGSETGEIGWKPVRLFAVSQSCLHRGGSTGARPRGRIGRRRKTRLVQRVPQLGSGGAEHRAERVSFSRPSSCAWY